MAICEILWNFDKRHEIRPLKAASFFRFLSWFTTVLRARCHSKCHLARPGLLKGPLSCRVAQSPDAPLIDSSPGADRRHDDLNVASDFDACDDQPWA
jgi:hypothetical protein